MTIRRIIVSFVDPKGETRGSATGSVDRRAELVRTARCELEQFKTDSRRQGVQTRDDDYTMSIEDAPATAAWSPRP